MRFPEDVPVLTDGVVTLRAHTPADVEPAYEMCQDADMQHWTTIPVPYEREHAVAFVTEFVAAGWRDGGSWTWAIDYDGRFAGSIDLRGGDGNGGEIGFGLAPWARGNRVMTRAIQLTLTYAFNTLGWDRVGWRAFGGNWASRKAVWNCGFRRFQIVTGGVVVRGVRRDEWLASITRDEDREPQGNWWTIPVIEGDGFRLRPLEDRDIERTTEACADERTQHWLSAMPSPYTAEHAKGFIETRREFAATGSGVSWAIADAGDDRLLGNVSVFDMTHRVDHTLGEIGYWAHPDARGRGVMTAAVALVIRQAFTPIDKGGLGRRRLVLLANEPNSASRHIAEANGFTQVGVQRATAPLRDGSYDNLVMYDLLATEVAL
ncbi:GNAT family N-acetyltransferase [Kribbella sp. NBC_01245]|uniref:GNAT family N-acetyltransferase n=1 Tax=Kribbella sp. NBC_01245 TaxID=2903578 RepID=UPI002E2CA1DE|nr:GNAT family N-acetyltransferase [Kribbella sp. NBC_01245]